MGNSWRYKPLYYPEFIILADLSQYHNERFVPGAAMNTYEVQIDYQIQDSDEEEHLNYHVRAKNEIGAMVACNRLLKLYMKDGKWYNCVVNRITIISRSK